MLAAVVAVVVIVMAWPVAVMAPVLEYAIPVWLLAVMVTPPELEVIARAPCVNPTPEPLATALMVTPVVLAKVPAVNAPVMVIPAPFRKALAGVTVLEQPKHVLSNRI